MSASVNTPASLAGRCAWADTDAAMQIYHDTEWGKPERDSRALFEKLLLDGLQAGLSWRTILHRRAGLRDALDGFDPVVMAQYDAVRQQALGADARLIRNRAKIAALIGNAKAYLALANKQIDFAAYLWNFVGHTPKQHTRSQGTLAPTQSDASVAMAKALKRDGFKFCGPTICYAFMQAVGMVNDHDSGCPCYTLYGGS